MAAIGATQDRRYINRFAKGKINESDTFYKSLVQKSGPAAKTFKDKFNCWVKAYNANLERIKFVIDLENKLKDKYYSA